MKRGFCKKTAYFRNLFFCFGWNVRVLTKSDRHKDQNIPSVSDIAEAEGMHKF